MTETGTEIEAEVENEKKIQADSLRESSILAVSPRL
jgi:hypothetical protein